MRNRYLGIVCIVGLVLTVAGLASAEDQPPVIEDIVVEGGVTLQLDSVVYYLGLEPGDEYDQEVIEEGFHRLWDSGLFEHLRIEKEETAPGKVVLYVIVEERPFVRDVIFEGNDKLSRSAIRDGLDQRAVDLPRKVPLRVSQLEKIRTALKEVYDEKGYQSAQIEYRIEDVSKTEKRVVYEIREGGKVKIGDITFVGNEVFSDRRLRWAMDEVKEVHWYRPWGKKIIYSDESWEADRENLRDFYLNHGYIDVKIGKPEVELVAKRPEAEKLKKKKFRVHMTIPIEEGERYRVGNVDITGVEVLNPDFAKQLFRVKEGDWYSHKEISEGMENLRKLYHNRGYVYAYTNELREAREDAPQTVDVTIDVFEGDRFRLGRLEFKGNTKTHEKVLRREFRIAEGQWMNMGLFRSSVFKVNALGYFKLDEEPLSFDFDDEKKRVNVEVKGREVGRNDLQFGAGYSELDGFFAQVQFNTRNFLGRGETLGVSFQSGARSDYYSLTFREPYLFDRRILFGASLFNTNLDIADFYRETQGGSFTLGMGVGIFSSVSAVFAYEDVESRFAVFRSGVAGDPTAGHRRPVGLPPRERLDEAYTYEEFLGKTVAITPAYRYDSRDDPFDPNRGMRFYITSRWAGGPLGGDYEYWRPEFQFSIFRPLNRTHIVGFNLEGGQFFTQNDSDIPIYARYRLGGDRSLRGIPYYTVVPRTEDGEYFLTPGGSRLGGDRYWVANFEYQIRVGGPVKVVLFADVGNTYHESQGWLMDQFRKTTGVELRVFVPIFQAPIRFIYGINLDPFPEEDSSEFQFSVGTTF